MSIAPSSGIRNAGSPKPRFIDELPPSIRFIQAAKDSSHARPVFAVSAWAFNPLLQDLAVCIGGNHEATAFLVYHLDIAGFAFRHIIGPCAASAPKGF